jgi:hypothetical protein
LVKIAKNWDHIITLTPEAGFGVDWVQLGSAAVSCISFFGAKTSATRVDLMNQFRP